MDRAVYHPAAVSGEKHVDDFTAQARRRLDIIRPQFDIHTTGVDRMVQRHMSRKTVSVGERKERYVGRALIISDDWMNVVG